MKVLVFRGGALGDFLLTLPTLVALRSAYPQAEIYLFGTMPQARLAHPFPATATYDLNGGALTSLFRSGEFPAQPWVDAVRNADLALSYLFDPDKVVAGNLARLGVGRLVVGPSRVDERGPHALEQLAFPVNALLGRVALGWPTLPIAVDRGQENSRHPLALHVGSGARAKNWPVSHWADLVRQLRKVLPEQPVTLVCGEADAAATDEFLARLPDLQVECWRGLPLPELAGRLSRCRALLGHDSGISHLAAAAGTPVFALFGPTNPEVWAPRGPDVKVIRAPTRRLPELDPGAVWAEFWPWLQQPHGSRQARPTEG
ncbi:MAG TPA: glycosyltransferase family 9 protein [Chthoniobacterales bacterium]